MSFTLEELQVRNSVKCVLLNCNDELLLVRTCDASIRDSSGSYNGDFWQMVGGKIEDNETVEEAARRELFEETGLSEFDVNFGRIVWSGKLILVMNGVKTLINQRFMVVRSCKNEVTIKNLTQEEQNVIKELKWFALDDIKNNSEIIYPLGLYVHLRNLLYFGLSKKVINIELGKKPINKNGNE